MLGRAKGEQRQAKSSLRKSRTLSSLMEKEIRGSHSCRPSRCCMQSLEGEHSQSLGDAEGSISPCFICVGHHTHSLGKVLIRPVGSLPKEIIGLLTVTIGCSVKSITLSLCSVLLPCSQLIPQPTISLDSSYLMHIFNLL